MEGDAVRDMLPSFGCENGLLAVMRNHGFVRSPGSYVGELADAFKRAGGSVVRADVKDFQLEDGRIRAVETDAGRFECAAAVVATGAWSKPLVRKLGLSVPLETERGYHVVFKNPSIKFDSPVMVAEGRFVATSMRDGLRCAGVLEFGGLTPPPSRRPLEFIRERSPKPFRPELGR